MGFKRPGEECEGRKGVRMKWGVRGKVNEYQTGCFLCKVKVWPHLAGARAGQLAQPSGIQIEDRHHHDAVTKTPGLEPVRPK